MRIRIAAFAAILALFPRLLLAQTPESPPPGMANEFVRVVVNGGPRETGRFSISTTGGDPSRPDSQDKHLIFGGNAPWTSYTTVVIDGARCVFGGFTTRRAGKSARYGQMTGIPQVTDDSVTLTGKLDDIEVTQELSFMRGPSTRMLDTVRITYRLVNKGQSTHQVGLRLLLDTMCGSNDGAPVRAGDQAIVTATALAGKAVPDYWQAFDSISSPTVISQGTLRGGDLTPPERILIADWGTLADDPWEPALTPGQGFTRKGETDPDTAAALFWDPAPLDPGAARVIGTAYGIGGVSLRPGQLALALTAPADTVFMVERTQPFTMAAYVENNGGFDARDVVLGFTVPEGLELLNGKPRQTFERVQKGETIQANWTLRANGKTGGKLPLALAVTSSNIEANQISREIQVAVPPPRLKAFTERASVPLETNGLPTVVLVPITLTPAAGFSSARLVLAYDPAVLVPFDLSRGRAFVDGGVLLPDWTYDLSQEGRVVIAAARGSAAPLTQAEVNLAVIKFRAVAPGTSGLKFTQAALIDGKGETIPVESEEAFVTVLPGI